VKSVAAFLDHRVALTDLVHSFERKKAFVVGDAIRDDYVFGRIDRLSPEAPVPVFIAERTESRRGGADHVCAQLEQLGLQTITFLTPTPSVKTRYLVQHHQVFRIDRDSSMAAATPDRHTALGLLDQGIDVVVMSDYAKGWLTAELAGCLIAAAAELNIPVVVDPKLVNWARYQGAMLFCPNHLEWERHSADFAPPFVWVKRGAEGIEVREHGRVVGAVAATARSVIDVTGAGDIVTACAAAGAAVGAGSMMAARLACLAAGHAVSEVGTSVCSKAKLLELIEEMPT
jgi:bifunctional ADP-heptose synthase (sugar kinase/adenylyltransferase)